jgi:hypothetical protein
VAEIDQNFGGSIASVFKMAGPILKVSSLKTETVGFLKTLVSSYQATWRHFERAVFFIVLFTVLADYCSDTAALYVCLIPDYKVKIRI